MTQPDSIPTFLVTPQVLDLFVRALVNEVDYDIHKNYECGEEDGLDHYPELVATAAEQLGAITAGQPDGLQPGARNIDIGWNNGPLMARIHLAFSPDMPDDERDQLVTDIADAIAGTVPVR